MATVNEATHFNKIDITRYKEGDFFITKTQVGILLNGKIKVLNQSQPNLKDYVKRSEVEQMIDVRLKKSEG